MTAGPILPGENQIAGKLKPLPRQALLQLKNASPEIFAEKTVEAGTAAEFKFKFNVPPVSKSEIWTLEIINPATREKMEVFTLPVNAATPSVDIVSADVGGICGQDLSLRIYAKVSNFSAAGHLFFSLS